MALTICRGTNSVADGMPGCSGQLGQPAVRPSLASCVHTLRHVPDLPAALCHIKTLLAPGGLVLIRVRRVTESLFWTSPGGIQTAGTSTVDRLNSFREVSAVQC